MTEVTPNLPHLGNFCKYCFMGTLLVGSILLEIPRCDGHALGDLHQPIGQSRHFFLSQNALGHTLGALLFCGKLLIIILLLFILWQSPDKR